MKRRKKLCVITMSLCMAIGLSISSTKAIETFKLVEESDGVKIYKNKLTKEMYADIDLTQLDHTRKMTVYHNDTNGIRIGIDIMDAASFKKLHSEQTTGWSSGTLPEGLSTLRPHISTKGLEASFYVDVIGNYPARIMNTYTPIFKKTQATVNSYEVNVTTEQSQKDLPARVELTYNYTVKKFGFVLGSHAGYFTLEVNAVGQIRLSWA